MGVDEDVASKHPSQQDSVTHSVPYSIPAKSTTSSNEQAEKRLLAEFHKNSRTSLRRSEKLMLQRKSETTEELKASVVSSMNLSSGGQTQA